MNVHICLKPITWLVLFAVLFLASCSEDSLDNGFSSERDDEADQTFEVCAERSTYESGYPLSFNEVQGRYIKFRQLGCDALGCDETPSTSVLYPNLGPYFMLNSDGSFSNQTGPLQVYETWTLIPAEGTDVLNRLELKTSDIQDDALEIRILEAGPCIIRIEHDQGWVEYIRLEEV